MRITVILFIIALLLVPLSPCLFASTSTPSRSIPTRAVDDWNQFRGNEKNSGIGPEAGTPTDEMLWKYGTGSGIESSPAVVDGKVFFGSKDGNVYCLDALTGVEKWHFVTGGDISCSPLVMDSRVYIGSGDEKLYCLNAEYGMEQWNFSTGGAVLGSPGHYGDRLYFGSDDGHLYSIWPTNGTHSWNFSISDKRTDVWGTPAFLDGLLYIGDSSGRLVCLDAFSGEFLFDILTYGDIYSSVCIYGDSIFFTTGISRTAHRYDAKTGQLIWTFETPTDTYTSPCVANGSVFLSDYEYIYCLPLDDPDGNGFITPGEVEWKHEAENFEGGSSPLYLSGMLMCGMGENLLYLSATNGSLQWFFPTSGKIVSCPVYSGDNTYVTSDDGFLYCLLGIAPDGTGNAGSAGKAAGPGGGPYYHLTIPIALFVLLDAGLLAGILLICRRRRSRDAKA